MTALSSVVGGGGGGVTGGGVTTGGGVVGVPRHGPTLSMMPVATAVAILSKFASKRALSRGLVIKPSSSNCAGALVCVRTVKFARWMPRLRNTFSARTRLRTRVAKSTSRCVAATRTKLSVPSAAELVLPFLWMDTKIFAPALFEIRARSDSGINTSVRRV